MNAGSPTQQLSNEEEVGGRKLTVTVDVDKAVWFTFRALAHSHKISLNRAVEGVLRDALKRAGVEVRLVQDSASAKYERPGLVRP